MSLLLIVLFLFGLGAALYLFSLRRQKQNPDQKLEDCLKWLFKRTRENRTSTVAELKAALPLSEEEINNCLAELKRRGWVVEQTGLLSLTPSGTSDALRIIRAHRLAELQDRKSTRLNSSH